MPIDAAASLCPAWDISVSFEYLRSLYPRMDSFILNTVRDFFVERPENATAMAAHPKAVEAARAATTLNEFVEACVPFAGCNDMEHYHKCNNPMEFAFGNTTPTIVLNSLDDFLCVKENIRLDLLDRAESYALLVTDEGSHIAYSEGCFGQGNYMWRLTLDFFEAVKRDKEETKGEVVVV